MERVSRRTRISWLALLALGALLAGCATGPTGVFTTLPSLPTATLATAPTATATTAPLTTIAFTCPATVNGAVKVFSDSVSGLTFDYPATWTEKDCHRYVAENIGPNGSTIAGQSILIGNLFIVAVAPHRGLTIQQFVSDVQGSDETVTLTPLTVTHAVEADTLKVTISSTAAQPPRFAQTLAIIAGTQSFYEVSGLVLQL
jgi:hypothetical protein